MITLETYLQKIYDENTMRGSIAPGATSKEFSTGKGAAGHAENYQLELVGKDITGFINNQDIGKISVEEFSKQYPEMAKEILQILYQRGMAAKFAPDKKPPYDFVKGPTTKNKLIVTPDME
jgi:hypothetical protein